MTLGNIISLIGLGLTILGSLVGFVVAFGRVTERLKAMEDRVKEDREKNEKQHEEFYSVKNDTLVLGEQMRVIGNQLSEVKSDIKEILSRLPVHRRADD